jgi:hypothetical protein
MSFAGSAAVLSRAAVVEGCWAPTASDFGSITNLLNEPGSFPDFRLFLFFATADIALWDAPEFGCEAISHGGRS